MASDNLLLRPRHRCYHCIHAVCGHQDPALCNLLHRLSPRQTISLHPGQVSTDRWLPHPPPHGALAVFMAATHNVNPAQSDIVELIRISRAPPTSVPLAHYHSTVYTSDVVILYPKCDAMPSASILRPVGANFSFLSASPVQEDLSVTSLYL